ISVKMVLTNVYLTSDTYALCIAHAFTNEKEEIMGLLIGEVVFFFDNYEIKIDCENETCHISSAMILKRSDKRPDRVEISPEQLSNASNHAEHLSEKLNKPMRIVGWYHSHPHITVWPSNVDLKTQASYQLMDDRFVGLIFSVFNQDKSNRTSRWKVLIFYFTSTQYERVDVNVHITPSTTMCTSILDSYQQLHEIIWQEEKELFESTKSDSLDLTSSLHNGAVYTKNVVQIVECIQVPLMNFMQGKLNENLRTIEHMKQKNEKL
ncbi:hypothetical protein HELRODRAFT_150937, partial [Helobdella robusta]|uniref:MPN domain-containing protein n=1 Tax=Helobdella robusta TaxID=6412 RepID=T1EKH9_HELRO